MIRRRDHKYPNIPVRPHIEGVPERRFRVAESRAELTVC